MKRISKKVRDEAAHLAALMASNVHRHTEPFRVFRDFADHSDDAEALYWDAWLHAVREVPHINKRLYHPRYDAEAEALLRTGWSPS